MKNQQHSIPSLLQDIIIQIFLTLQTIATFCAAYDVLLDKTSNPLTHGFPLEPTPETPLFIAGSCNGLLCVYYENNTPFIYTPSTRIWKKIPLSGLPMESGWLAKYGFGHDERSDDYNVIGLSHWNETSGEVLQPVYDEGDKDLTLGVLGACLCMICAYGVNYADVWVMKVYGVKNSWTKLVSIPYLTHPRINRYSVPLFILNDGKNLLKYGYQLVVYDSKNTPPFVFKNFHMCYQACTVVESLVSPILHSLGIGVNEDDRH
ncbi:hypothetical protein Tco_1234703 [Tanacetum coccineum]